MCVISEAVEEYVFHCVRSDNHFELLLVLTLLFAVKNNHRVVVERLLRDQRPLGGETTVPSQASSSAANPTVTGRAWEVARQIATRFIQEPDYGLVMQNNGCSVKSLFSWAVQQGHHDFAAALLKGKGIVECEEHIPRWATLHYAASDDWT